MTEMIKPEMSSSFYQNEYLYSKSVLPEGKRSIRMQDEGRCLPNTYSKENEVDSKLKKSGFLIGTKELF